VQSPAYHEGSTAMVLRSRHPSVPGRVAPRLSRACPLLRISARIRPRAKSDRPVLQRHSWCRPATTFPKQGPCPQTKGMKAATFIPFIGVVVLSVRILAVCFERSILINGLCNLRLRTSHSRALLQATLRLTTARFRTNCTITPICASDVVRSTTRRRPCRRLATTPCIGQLRSTFYPSRPPANPTLCFRHSSGARIPAFHFLGAIRCRQISVDRGLNDRHSSCLVKCIQVT
jgi:hypothetical protein